jgi:hypothetical protein
MTRPRGGVRISSTKEFSTFEKAPPMTKPCYYSKGTVEEHN